MSYLRPARQDEIVEFLLRHADLDVESLARVLADQYDILITSNTAT